MSSQLKPEFDFYVANQEALVRKFNGRFIVIKDQKVIGDYDSEGEALTETQKAHPLGTFLIQKVEPGTDAYTRTFHSRVAFAR